MKTKNYNRLTSCHFCNLSVFKYCKIFNCFDTFYNFIRTKRIISYSHKMKKLLGILDLGLLWLGNVNACLWLILKKN